MRVYARDEVCGFRFTRAAWGELSNFRPLSTPIPAGTWTFATAEHLYQAAKFAARPDLQERIAAAATAKEAKAIGGTGGASIDPGWDRMRIDAMRWVLRRKRETNRDEIDRVLAATGERPIVEVSTRDTFWGARPAGDRYEGRNALGRLWMELRRQLRENDPQPRPTPGSDASASAASPADRSPFPNFKRSRMARPVRASPRCPRAPRSSGSAQAGRIPR